MYEHLVSFKFKRSLDAATQQDLLETLRALKGQIPGIIELTAGLNVTEETDNIHGFTLGLRVTFENKESLQLYGSHAAHQLFVRKLDGILDEVVVVDYPTSG